MRDPVGVAQRELHGRRGAGGDRHHVDRVEVEVVEQRDERVGLRGATGPDRQVRPEIAEARGGDDTPVAREVSRGHQPAVAAVEDAVADQQRLAGAAFGVLDRAERGVITRRSTAARRA